MRVPKSTMSPHDRRLLFVGVEQKLASGIGKSVSMEGRTTPSSNFDEEETGQVD